MGHGCRRQRRTNWGAGAAVLCLLAATACRPQEPGSATQTPVLARTAAYPAASTTADDATDSPAAPAGSYQYPIPGSLGLSGTFGEVRGTHLHHGIDIRTFERTGLPIRAAADGYVARVRISYSGYGKAIYVQHPDGNLTAYGHCDRFAPAIEAALQQRQRASRQFEQEIYPSPGQYPVRAGDTIAWSGNTGSSEGPHLHYEVRNRAEDILNPQAWHPGAVPDRLPPYFVRLALEPITPDARVAGRADKYVLPRLQVQGNTYTAPGVVPVQGRIGVEFAGYDRAEGSGSRNGVYAWALYLDDEAVFQAQMDRFSFDQVRESMQLVDYAYYRRHGTRLTKCYQDEGLTLPVFRAPRRGFIDLDDNAVHTLRLVLRDYAGNTATALLRIQRAGVAATAPANAPAAAVAPQAAVRRGLLVLRGSAPPAGTAAQLTVQYADGASQALPLNRAADGGANAVLPLQANRIPVRVSAPWWPAPLETGYHAVVAPEAGTRLTAWPGLDAEFAPGSVFHALPLRVAAEPSPNPVVVSDIYRIGDPRDALNRGFRIRITANARAARFRPEQIVLAETWGRRFVRASTDYRLGNTWHAQVRSFGSYCLVADVDAPAIRPLNFRVNGLVRLPYLKFDLRDGLSGVHPYQVRVWLDGEWMPAEYYGYQHALFLRLDHRQNAGLAAPLRAGRHVVRITATDYAGNTATRSYGFVTR